MAIRVDIDDNKLSNFSNDAQDTLKLQLEKYANDIIKESNLIEEGLREDEASTEITSSFVIQAVRKNRTSRPKKAHKHLFKVKVVSFVSVFISGALLDFQELQGSMGKLIAFIIFFVIASVSTVLQFSWEERE